MVPKARAEARAERILKRCLGRAAHRSLGAACSSWYDFLRFQEITETRCGQARALRSKTAAAAAVPRIQQMAPRPRAVHATFKCSRAPRAAGAAHRAAIDNARLGAALDVWCAQRHKVSRAERARRRSVEALRLVLTRYASRDRRAAFRLFVDVTRLPKRRAARPGN